MSDRPPHRGDTPSVEVLVSTMNRVAPPSVLPEMEDVDLPDVLVINQCTQIQAPAPIEGERWRMLSVAERGLSRSRNLALDRARGDLLVFADDDVRFLPSASHTVRLAFARVPDAAILTFQFLDATTGRLAKDYRAGPARHTGRTISGVSSIEIAVRRSAIGALRFDTRFGLGSALPSGEEAIFLADALRRGLHVGYWPEPICTHPGMGSGYGDWTRDYAMVKGAVARRIYPRAWPGAILYFAVTKRRFYGACLSTPGFVTAAVSGALHAASDT